LISLPQPNKADVAGLQQILIAIAVVLALVWLVRFCMLVIEIRKCDKEIKRLIEEYKKLKQHAEGAST